MNKLLGAIKVFVLLACSYVVGYVLGEKIGNTLWDMWFGE